MDNIKILIIASFFIMAINYSTILSILIFIDIKQAYQMKNRMLIDDCEYGQFQSSSGCQNCSYQCQICSHYSICTSCLDLNHRYLFNNQCHCQQGYFDIANQSTCACTYLQVFISTIYDFNLCIFTTIYCSLRYDSFNDYELSFLALALSLLSMQIIGLYSLISIITVPRYQLKSSNFKSKYSGLFEGMRVYDLTSRKLAFAMILKRILFISLIALLYENALYQVGVQTCIQLTFLIFALVMNPFLKTQLLKQLNFHYFTYLYLSHLGLTKRIQ